VSQATVSRVLNKDATLSVSAETREKILRTAAELGYRTVSQRYTEEETGEAAQPQVCIGIAQMFELKEQMEDIYYLVMKNILEEECFACRWGTVTMFRNEERRFVKNDDRKLDGIIAIGRFTGEEIESFHAYTDNVVFIDSSPDELKYYSIVPNYHMAVRRALACFREKGHDRIAYLGSTHTFGDRKELMEDARYYYYKTALVNNGTFESSLVIDCEMNARSGYEKMKAFLQGNDRLPSALFVASDVVAPGLINALQEAGLRIPEDISVITFNNTSLSEFANPPLASIEVFMRENAKAALLCMRLLWEGAQCPKKIVIPCDLVMRGSVRDRNEQTNSKNLVK